MASNGALSALPCLAYHRERCLFVQLCDGAGRSGTISWPDFLAVLRTHEMIPSDADPDAEEIVALSLLEAAHEWSIAQNAWRDGPLRPSHTRYAC